MLRTRTLAAAALAVVLAACGSPLKPKEMRQSRHTLASGGTLDASSALVVSTNKIVATKTIPKDQNATQTDPGLAAFSAGLYPKLKQYCGACHAGQNKTPFASPGLDLAYAAVKPYVASPAEESQIIKNVRASHNGVDPALEGELAPLVEAVAVAAGAGG